MLHAGVMALRAIASLSLTFGLVSIPVKLYSATESAAAVRFKWMSRGGARLRQQYVVDAVPGTEDGSAPAQVNDASGGQHTRARDEDEPPPSRAESTRPVSLPARPAPTALPVDVGDTVERAEMVKAYEYEKGKFVLFTPAELEALRAASRESIDIVAFIPITAIDPIYYDKAYLLAPGKRADRTYALLLEALRRSQTSALARWAWRGKEYVVQIRPGDGGLLLQQLFFADEVRLPRVLNIELTPVDEAALKLALQLIDQLRQTHYDPLQYVDEEKRRVLELIDRKIAGRQTVSHAAAARKPIASAEVVDLMAALRASLRGASQGRPLPARKPVSRAPLRGGAAASPIPAPPRKTKAAN